jgi:hypothetical protein
MLTLIADVPLIVIATLIALALPLLSVIVCLMILSSRISREEEKEEKTPPLTTKAMTPRRSRTDD